MVTRALKPGLYQFTYSGNVTDPSQNIRFGGNVRMISQSSQPWTIEVLPANTLDAYVYLDLYATDSNNPLHNLRLIRQDHVGTGCFFDSDFVNKLRPFRVLRFLDWQNPNAPANFPARWADEKPVNYQSLAGRNEGSDADRMPVEIMVRLANEIGADAWFTIPFAAPNGDYGAHDNDYVRRSARYVAQNLRPGLKVYVEHANEIWNFYNPQRAMTQFCRSTFGSRVNAQSDFSCALIGHAERTVRVGAIYEEEWRNAGRNDRDVIVTLGGQRANAGIAETMLSWLRENYGGQIPIIEAYNVAPYFATEFAEEVNRRGPNRFPRSEAIAWIREEIDVLMESLRNGEYSDLGTLQRFAPLTRNGSIGYIAYEGGEHFVATPGMSREVRQYLLDLKRSPEYQGLVSYYLDRWHQVSGGGMFCWYSSIRPISDPAQTSGYGYYWQIWDTTFSGDTPTWLGIRDYLERYRR